MKHDGHEREIELRKKVSQESFCFDYFVFSRLHGVSTCGIVAHPHTSHHAAAKRGSVVTYTSPVEVFATGIKNFDR